MNRILKLIEDFNEFRKVREVIKTSVLTTSDKTMVMSYNKDFERKLNEIVIDSLVEKLLEREVSKDWVNGFKSALTVRMGILSYTSKFNNN